MKLLGPAAVVLPAKITRRDIPALCERARAQVEHDRCGLIVCDVNGVVDPDAVVVDALARIQLTVRRLGCMLHLRGADAELRDLLEFVGLSDVVGRARD